MSSEYQIFGLTAPHTLMLHFITKMTTPLAKSELSWQKLYVYKDFFLSQIVHSISLDKWHFYHKMDLPVTIKQISDFKI